MMEQNKRLYMLDNKEEIGYHYAGRQVYTKLPKILYAHAFTESEALDLFVNKVKKLFHATDVSIDKKLVIETICRREMMVKVLKWMTHDKARLIMLQNCADYPNCTVDGTKVLFDYDYRKYIIYNSSISIRIPEKKYLHLIDLLVRLAD